MPDPTFKCVSVELFAQLLGAFPFTRHINAVHMHHTGKPDRSGFDGHPAIIEMWRHHTRDKGWRDIAQHITIDPVGKIWLGRNWDMPPVSAAGHNGNSAFGPFMIELVGNFDRGYDLFDGVQSQAAISVIALVQARFNLTGDTLVFHNAMSARGCPGSGMDRAEILLRVKQLVATDTAYKALKSLLSQPSGPFPNEPDLAVDEALKTMRRAAIEGNEVADAELSHDGHGSNIYDGFDGAESRGIRRDNTLNTATLDAMRPHLINLTGGRFSTDGQLATSTADVDQIFRQYLPTALKAAKAQGQALKLMFYAHGGLISENDGILIAAKHIDWWKQNGIYPIYFIWETGLIETLVGKLKRASERTSRGPLQDLTGLLLDPIVESAVRALRGASIWGGMKWNAEHSVDAPSLNDPSGGGAYHVAARLKEFCMGNESDIELHAVGHSAGAIFHSYFLSTAHDLKVPTFESLQLLAPAVRVDTFKTLLANKIGASGAARKLTVFTMKKDLEKADNCGPWYHKSLLYLISNALEEAVATPILGLEESIRDDDRLRALFGLGGNRATGGEVIWSVSSSDSGLSASTARTHGGFDDDAPTMDSMARRILGKADADAIADYGNARGIAPLSRAWTDHHDAVSAVNYDGGDYTPSNGFAGRAVVPAAPQMVAAAIPYTNYRSASATRRALCVGIDRYPDPEHELTGCVADAHMWASMLSRHGFAVKLMTDHQVTRDALARELFALVRDSHAGDVIVFQYAGHGISLPDLNGDEIDHRDEAICPIDFASGAFYLDDDIGEVFASIPDDVNFSCFMDCCHSGTNSRFAVADTPVVIRRGLNERKRYIRPTAQLLQAHRKFREKIGASGRGRGDRGGTTLRDVKFAACRDSEVAWESDGHGEFTLRAMRALAGGFNGMSNEQFIRQLKDDFGPTARQHPLLECAEHKRQQGFLHALNGNGLIIPATELGAVDLSQLTRAVNSLNTMLTHIAH